MKHFLFILLSAFLLGTSCAPVVKNTIVKKYPALEQDEEVSVYFDKNKIPPNAELLGSIKVMDSGFSINCDSVSVVRFIKDESRKAGANAAYVFEHLRPSFWGSSCHQMNAAALRINGDSCSLANTTALFVDTVNVKPERKLSKITLYLAGGYGWRTAELSPDLDGFLKEYYEKLASGFVCDASFNYYFNDMFGLGLLYSAYSTSNSEYAHDTKSGATGYLNANDLISFIGPVFSMRMFYNTQWIFDMGLGIGYIGYTSKLTFPGMNTKITGSSVGSQANLGVEYKFSKDWGIYLNISSLSGVLNKLKFDNNGMKETKTFETGKGESLDQFRMLLGMRYHIK